MKGIVLGIVALMSVSGPAMAQDQSYHVQYFYYDDSNRYVGRFVIYCDGRELYEGEQTGRYTVHLGRCNAP